MTLNSRLQTYQILTNDDQVFILCRSYFITSVHIEYNILNTYINVRSTCDKNLGDFSQEIRNHHITINFLC